MKQKLITLVATLAMGATLLSAAPTEAPKPFLIQDKLPHLSSAIKVLWDDADLALSENQKIRLTKVREETVSSLQALNKQIIPLEAKIVAQAQAGKAPNELKADIENLATLRAQATLIHITCIYNTKLILSKKQFEIIE